MNPADFMALADRLAISSEEAELRTAIGRAYYSAFHTSKVLIDGCDVLLPKSAEAHSKVVYCLKNAGDPFLDRAGSALGNLRESRNTADYDLTQGQFKGLRHVLSQIALAKQTVAWIRAVDPQAVGNAIRAYAKNILGLQVK
jgi:uncharacterized protein (UPF0332 family)